jgi:hypothetical protein
MAFTLVTFPFASTSAETTTVPCVFDCLAIEGYTGCVEEISLGSRMLLPDGAEEISEDGGAG